MAQKRQYYTVYGDDRLKFIVNDSAGPLFHALAEKFPQHINRAIRHTVWWAQKELKAELRKGIAGGIPLKPLTKIKNRKLINRVKKTKELKRINASTLDVIKRNRPYQNLVKAIGYQHIPAKMFARVGWLSKAAARRGRILQAGSSVPITDKQRHFFAANRVPISPSTRTIDIPPRPVMMPFFIARHKQMFHVAEKRIMELLKKEKMKHIRKAQKRLTKINLHKLIA